MHPDRWRVLRRAAHWLRPHAGSTVVVLALTFLSGGLGAIEPLLLKGIFDGIAEFAPGTGLGRVVRPLAWLALLVIGRQLAEGATTIIAWRTRLRVNRDILEEATGRLHTLPLAYHQGRGIGETMTRLDRGVTAFLEALSTFAFQTLPAAVYVVVSLVVMLRLSPLLALVAVLFVLPPVVTGGSTAQRLIDRERASLERWARIYNRLQQVLAGIRTVKAFAREVDEHRDFVKAVEGAQRDVFAGIKTSTALGTSRSLCVQLGRVAVLATGAWLASRGELGPGTLVAFLGYVGGLYAPAQTLLALFEQSRRAELGLETLFDVLDAEDAVPDRPDAVVPHAIAGEVRFERVTFGYGASGAPALRDVTFRLAPGELVAVVGPSGAGKTTLADLVLRLHDPTSGVVRVDGVDLRDYAQRELRRRIGVVPQEPFLFEDTIANNIAYGVPHASRAEIERAAREAHVDEFVERLPLGYEARVGRGGVALSGGERQRVAIARVLLEDPAIVVLDEPTSALDIQGELAVQDAIERLARNRTTIVIAHRLGTTTRADRVLVLEQGRLVQEGAPADLLAREGPYRRMMDLWRAPHAPARDGGEAIVLTQAEWAART